MRQLSPELKQQLYGQESDDPFLTLLTMSHDSWAEPMRFVDNYSDIISRGDTYVAFPFQLSMPDDDGETAKDIKLSLDNVSLELIRELRTITTPINIHLEMILASIPDAVQLTISDLKMRNASYNRQSIGANLYLDDFLNTEMASEKYTPTAFAGIF